MKGGIIFLRAVIMAGGEGQRLRPITCTQPKPMAELLNKPTMQYCVELLKKHGITDITATLHYIPNNIKEYFGDGGYFGVSMQYSVEDKPMGTAGSVRYALGNNIDESVLVISGDAIFDVDLSEAISEHKKNGAAATIVLKKVEDPTEYGVVLCDKNGFITRFLEKPMPNEVFSDLVNTGIYILEKEATELIKENTVVDFSKDLFPLMLERKMPIYGYETSKYWCDIGDIREYMNAQVDLMNKKCRADLISPVRDGVYIEDGTRISHEAVLVPPCYIGSGTEIAENVIIGPETVIGRNVKIGRNSSVKHSVLMKDVHLRENCEIRGAILCEGVKIGNRNSVFEYAVIGAKTQTAKDVMIDSSVLVWPRKLLESAKYFENIVWQKEINARGENFRKGYADEELSPEKCVVIGQSVASVLKGENAMLVATDGTQAGAMLKHALISGIVSQGRDVLDAGYTTLSQFEFTIRDLSLSGGVYIKTGDEAQLVKIMVHDEFGALLGANDLRKLEREIKKGVKKPVTSKRLGIAEREFVSNRAYEAELLRQIPISKLKDEYKFDIVICGKTEVYDAVARMLLNSGIRARMLPLENKEQLLKSIITSGAKLGFYVNHDNDIKEVYFGERLVSAKDLDAVFLLDRMREENKKEIVVSAEMSDEYVSLLCENGAIIEKVPNEKSVLMRKNLKKQSYYPEMFEAEARILKTVSLVLQKKLELYLNSLPKVYTSEKEKECSFYEIGRVLRSLVEMEQDDKVELIDGVRVRCDNGWVLVKPNSSFNACRVVAGSFKEEYSEELSEIYRKRVEDILKKQ